MVLHPWGTGAVDLQNMPLPQIT